MKNIGSNFMIIMCMLLSSQLYATNSFSFEDFMDASQLKSFLLVVNTDEEEVSLKFSDKGKEYDLKAKKASFIDFRDALEEGDIVKGEHSSSGIIYEDREERVHEGKTRPRRRSIHLSEGVLESFSLTILNTARENMLVLMTDNK